MSLLDWNSIENSRHGITDSKKVPSKFNPLPLNDFGYTLKLVNFFVDNFIFNKMQHAFISSLQHKVSNQDTYQDIQYLGTLLLYGFVSTHL